MKKANGIFLLLASLLILSLLSGCGSVSEGQYNELLTARDDLLSQNESLKNDLANASTPAKAAISGSFTATMRSTVPDYSSDSVTPYAAVVTCFQSGPMLVPLEEELIEQLEPGEIYVFQIAEKSIELPCQVDDPIMFTYPEVAIPMFGLRIESVRLAEESEYGLEYNHIMIDMEQ